MVLDCQEKREAWRILTCCAQAFLKHHRYKPVHNPLLRDYWQEFYNWTTLRIRKQVHAGIYSPADCDDVVQQVWESVVRKLPHFQWNHAEGFFSWINKVVRCKIADYRRRAARESLTNRQSLSNSEDNLGEMRTDPAQAAQHKERCQLVRDVLRELRLQGRSETVILFEMHYCENLNVPTIARKVGLTPAVVTARIHRLKRLVRNRLEIRYPVDFAQGM